MDTAYSELTVASKGGGHVIDVTSDLQDAVDLSQIIEGLICVSVPGATASITTIEFESGVVRDLQKCVNRLIPENIHYDHNERWQDGNGHSHVRAGVLGPSQTFPIHKGRIVLGTWQQIVVIDFDNCTRQRRVAIQVLGSKES